MFKVKELVVKAVEINCSLRARMICLILVSLGVNQMRNLVQIGCSARGRL